MAGLRLDDVNFEKFKDIVYQESGICFNSVNRVVLEARINDNIKKLQLSSFDDYYKLLKTSQSEMRNFLDSVTTNLTKFFRNDAHFKAFNEHVLPEILKRKSASKSLKIWCAGCSTGEEPYSVAMSILENPGFRSWNVKISASDLSLKSLVTAKAGRYRSDKLDKVDPKIKEKYFDKVADDYVVKDSVKKLIRFDYHNLKNKSSFENMDVIFCRNVIIYFDAESQQQTIDRFYNALGEDGYLYIGHSESLFGMKTQFQFNKVGTAIVYTKGNVGINNE